MQLEDTAFAGASVLHIVGLPIREAVRPVIEEVHELFERLDFAPLQFE
ncbi:MAG TPA: hypothetical protein VLC46_21900 [Thermoanaerobaculia bacterium]|nr:hypothetical protein [Thermoanaerobaculia bacterium]